MSLNCYRIPLPVVANSLNSLVKARLKTLFLSYVGARVECGTESMFTTVCEGFHNLESLEMQYFESDPALVPLAVAQMERGEFPCLHTLRIYMCRLPESDGCKLFQAICHSRLPCLKSLDLTCVKFGDDIVDDAIRAMLHLKSLHWHDNFTLKPHTLAGVDRLETAAAACEDLELKILGAL